MRKTYSVIRGWQARDNARLLPWLLVILAAGYTAYFWSNPLGVSMFILDSKGYIDSQEAFQYFELNRLDGFGKGRPAELGDLSCWTRGKG